MSDASQAAHDLLLRHAVTADHRLALPVDPVAIARAEGVRMRNVYDAFDRWDAAVDLGRALKPDGADPGWAADFAHALLMPAEIVRVMFASDLNTPEMACGFDVPWCRVRRRLAMLGLDGYCERNKEKPGMDEYTPIEVPIQLEEWVHHYCLSEVETIVIDARLILDATDFDDLPAPDDWGADLIAEGAWKLGLLKPWDGPFTVGLPECGEYPAYLEWRGTHRVVEGAKERFRALARDEILSRIKRTQATLDRLVAEYKAI